MRLRVVPRFFFSAPQDARFLPPLPLRDELPDRVHDLPIQAAVIFFGQRAELLVDMIGKSNIDGHALSLPCHAASVAAQPQTCRQGVYYVVEFYHIGHHCWVS